MSDANLSHYLYLVCADLDYFPDDHSAFIQACVDKGLITESTVVNKNEYLVGDNFLQQVTFMGCSPYLKVYPDNEHDSDFCRVSIPSGQAQIEYKAGPQATAARCPLCRKAGQFPDDLVQQWQQQKTNFEVECSHCGQYPRLYELDWRRNAGFYHFHIRVSNIFPKEAIPNQDLLDWLTSITKKSWKYFYAQA